MFRFNVKSMLIFVFFACIILLFGQFVFQSAWWHGGVKPIRFNSKAWKRSAPIGDSRTVRSQMITDLLESYDFDGWSRGKVISLLGEPDAMPSSSGYENWHMAYSIGLERGNSFSLDMEFLIFRFNTEGQVVEYRSVVN